MRQQTHTVRRAETDDAAALTRLRALMLSAMGMLTENTVLQLRLDKLR